LGVGSGHRRMPEEIDRLATDAVADLLCTPSGRWRRAPQARGRAGQNVRSLANVCTGGCYTSPMHTSTRKLPLDELAALLEADETLDLAILFGSSAAGGLHADSDVDVAVLAGAPLTAQHRRTLIRGIAEIAGRPVDLVDLRTAGVPLTSQALRLVQRRPGVFADLLSRTLKDAADFLPYRERILRERRRAWIG
jgi:predicted nucleotidyltransferase